MRNSAPTVPGVSMEEGELLGIPWLQCSVAQASTDADSGDTVDYSFAWTLDGDAYTGVGMSDETSASLVAPPFGDWVCTVTASDGTDTASASATAILNNPPVIASIEFDADSYRTDDVITATVSASDGDADDNSICLE